MLMSTGGYLAFTDMTKPNILSNFSLDDKIVNSARLLFGVNMLLTFPMECIVCREVILNYLNRKESIPDDKSSDFQHYSITLLLVITSLLISLVTCDLGFVLELTGGFSATALAFILPAICYLKLSSKSWNIVHYCCLASVIFGTVVMVLATSLSIVNFLTSSPSKC